MENIVSLTKFFGLKVRVTKSSFVSHYKHLAKENTHTLKMSKVVFC